jgi:transposase InsO family protein
MPPTAEWASQQILEAFPFDTAPKYLLRDRDRLYGDQFRRPIRDIGLQEILPPPHSRWQRAYVERVIGSICRECLDHGLVFGQHALIRVLHSYSRYYHKSRLHLSLEKDSPDSRTVQSVGKIILLTPFVMDL